MKIAEQALKKYPSAQDAHRIEPPRTLPAGEVYLETECPRGQMGFYVVGRPAKDAVPLTNGGTPAHDEFKDFNWLFAPNMEWIVANIPASPKKVSYASIH